MTDFRTRYTANEDFSANGFQKPDPLFQPAYAWMWDVPIDKKGIDTQLEEMHSNGILSVYVLPGPKEFKPDIVRANMQPEYLSEEFFDLIVYAAHKALEKGMTLWLYDEGGYPSGSAATRVNKINPDYCRKFITSREVSVSAGVPYEPGERAIAAFTNDVEYIVPGTVFSNDTILTEYFAKPMGGYETDPLDEDVGSVFVKLTHEEYTRHLSDLFPKKDKAGAFIPNTGRAQLMFTDEPAAGRYPWPRGFAQKFRDTFHYDFAPFVPFLLNDDQDAPEEAVQARIDYHKLTGELFRQNYFVPIHEWCKRNGVLSAGHLDQDHLSNGCILHNYGSTLSVLREMDIPGVDVIWRHIFIPSGEKGPCKACGFFPRFASSAAAQSGSKYALSESFAVYGQGLTGDEMRYVINFQLVRGINVFNFMSTSYGRFGAYAMMARPSFVAEMPEYSHMRGINDYCARAGYLMQLGRNYTPCALYYPVQDIWAGGTRRKRALYEFDTYGHQLETCHVPFDIIDDEAILNANLESGKLKIGFAAYESVLIPDGVTVPPQVKKKLASISSKPVDVAPDASTAIRYNIRLLPNGNKLYMAFNESTEASQFECPKVKSTNIYRMFPEDGRIERIVQHSIPLACGEAAFILLTDDTITATEDPIAVTNAQTLTGFTLRKLKQTVPNASGLNTFILEEEEKPCTLGSWESYCGAAFSGECEYKTIVKLAVSPQSNDHFVLRLGKLECYASVYINGQYVGEVWNAQSEIHFDGELICGRDEFTLSLHVANTGANAFRHFDMPKYFDKLSMGGYQPIHNQFEAEAPMGGLYGPVTLLRDGIPR